MMELSLIPILTAMYRIRGGWINFGSTQLARTTWAITLGLAITWMFSSASYFSFASLLLFGVVTVLAAGSLVLLGHGAHQDGGTWLPANAEDAHKVTENLTRWFPNVITKPLWVRELWDWFGMTVIRFVGALIVFCSLSMLVPWYLIILGCAIVGLISGASYTFSWIAYNNYYIKEEVPLWYRIPRKLFYYKGKILLAIGQLIGQGKPTEVGELATGFSYALALLAMYWFPKFFS